MSRLEDAAKPSLAAMLNDLSIGLDRSQQALLSWWAMKTVMVFECTRAPKKFFYTEPEHVALRTTKLPARTNIWLGRYIGSTPITSQAMELGSISSEGVRAITGFCNTLTMRQLVVQVVTLRVPASVAPTTKATMVAKSGPWEQCSIQIWPVQRVIHHWPPPVSLDSAIVSLKEFADRWVVP